MSLVLSPQSHCFQVLDDKNVRRRFRASNYQSTTRVKPFICTMPMRLDDGWNQIQFNLSDFTRRAYGTNYIETLRVQVSARRSSQKASFLGHVSFLYLNSDPFPFVFRSMQTAELGGCISQTDCTRRMSFQQSSNSTCLSRTRKPRFRHTIWSVRLLEHSQRKTWLTPICLCVLAAVDVVNLHLSLRPDVTLGRGNFLCVDLWLTVNLCKMI